MIVSRGIGNSGFPFRVNNRPDLVFVILNKK
jgi:predicted MPP superfamily phosphohydrolase